MSVATAIRTPAARMAAISGTCGLPHEVGGAGQQHRDGAGRAPWRPARPGIGILQVVGRQRAVSRAERGAAGVGQLVGVQLHRQAVPPGGIEHPAVSLGREADAVAEGVHRVGQALGRDGGERSRRHAARRSRPAARELRRHGMGAEEGGDARRTGSARAERRATRSMRSSVSRSRP